mmetsp:Transcript_38900/g.96394  ORF Transcript_38900/g.96394 Transcript_38900/m.96394 type:complete len:289 (-) Transcript_38900:203-1069(-)
MSRMVICKSSNSCFMLASTSACVASSNFSRYRARCLHRRRFCDVTNASLLPYTVAGCPPIMRFAPPRPPLAPLRLASPSGHVPTCWCASLPQSARQYAQKPAEHREQFKAKHPSKSKNACLHLGQQSVRMPSMMCSLALRSFSDASAPDAARWRSRLTRASISFRISAAISSSRSFSRARMYIPKASCETLLAISLSAKCGARHRSAPFMASVLAGHTTRPSRFFCSPLLFPASLCTYASKQDEHVKCAWEQQMPSCTGLSVKHIVHTFSSTDIVGERAVDKAPLTEA